MFICTICLEKYYTNFGLSTSFGPCECCGEKKTCYDIASKFLNKKEWD